MKGLLVKRLHFEDAEECIADFIGDVCGVTVFWKVRRIL